MATWTRWFLSLRGAGCADRLPGATLHVLEGEGHISIGLRMAEIVDDLLLRAGRVRSAANVCGIAPLSYNRTAPPPPPRPPPQPPPPPHPPRPLDYHCSRNTQTSDRPRRVLRPIVFCTRLDVSFTLLGRSRLDVTNARVLAHQRRAPKAGEEREP